MGRGEGLLVHDPKSVKGVTVAADREDIQTFASQQAAARPFPRGPAVRLAGDRVRRHAQANYSIQQFGDRTSLPIRNLLFTSGAAREDGDDRQP